MFEFLARPVQALHSLCITNTPPHQNFGEFYAAIVCGAELPPSPSSQSLKVLGLYHLIVVSGSHFVVLEKGLHLLAGQKSRRLNIMIFGALLGFAIVCRLEPPVVRALSSFMLRKLTEEQKLFWQPHQVTFLSGVATLLAFPVWLTSTSFLLSWTASLLISLPISGALRKHALIYIGLLPILCGFQPLHPLTSVVNWGVGPLLGALLFPASLMAMLLPALTPATDLMWAAMIHLLDFLSARFPAGGDTTGGSLWIHWIYLLTLHFVVAVTILRHRRQAYESP